ncbi:dienelactone hydrolase family protein [Tsuneonella sp. HG222]
MQDFAARLTRRRFSILAAGLAFATTACATVPAAPAASERHVTIATPDGSTDALLFTPALSKAPAVLLWADMSGLRPVVTELGRKLAAEGYVVLAPNAYYRSLKLDGTTATTVDYATRNRDWRGAATDEKILADAKAYMAFLDAQPQVDTAAKAGALGYELGSVHAFLTARAAPSRIGAVAAIQPLAIATARPNSPHLLVKETQADYYVAIGSDADAREPEDKTDLAKAFADAGLKGSVVVVPGKHGFALSDSPNADAASASQAWAATVALLKSALR